MLAAPGILFPYLELWSKGGKELSIENYFGMPTCWIFPGTGYEASMPSIAQALRDLDYDSESLAIHAFIRHKDSKQLEFFRAQNCKLIKEEALQAVSDALDLSISSRPWTAVVLDRLGRVVKVSKNPEIGHLFQVVRRIADEIKEPKQVMEKHAPVTVLRSCLEVDGASLFSEVDASLEQSLEQVDYCLLTSAAVAVHRSYNFLVTRRSPIEAFQDMRALECSINQHRRFSRFTCVVAGQGALIKLSFPEFSPNHYSLNEGDMIVFPSNILCSVGHNDSNKPILLSRFFDDASARECHNTPDNSFFNADVMAQVFPAYIDRQDEKMPGYTFDPDSRGNDFQQPEVSGV